MKRLAVVDNSSEVSGRLSPTRAKVAHTAGAKPSFCNIKQLKVQYCYSPLDGMLVHCRVTPSSMSPVPILYTCEHRDNVG